MTKIIIAHPNSNPKRMVANLAKENTVWFSFNEDVSKINKWEKNISDFSKKLDIARDMERIYNDVYKKYSSLMADFGMKYKDYPEWWLSPLSEKNGWPPKYVTNTCIVAYLEKLLTEKGYDEIIVLTSSPFVLFKLKKIASSKKVKCLIYGGHYYFYNIFTMYIMHFFELIYFGYEFIINKIWLALYYKNTWLDHLNSSNIFLLRTYCHKSSFKEDGRYIDIQYGDLKEHLKKRGYTVVYQPNLSSMHNKRGVYMWFSKKSEDIFWILEKYLTFYDLIKAYAVIIKQFIMMHKLGYGIFLNLDPFFAITIGRNYLKSLVPVKLKKQKISPTNILFDWENKAYEKYMCILFKDNLPRTKVTGYLSGIPFPTGPEVNLIPKEAKLTPIPDKIVCCGQYAYDWLVYVGFDKKKLVVGPSIRQNHVFEENATRKTTKIDNSILAALPLNYNLSLELLTEMIRYAKRNPKHRLLVKPHPFFNINSILSKKDIPDNLSIVYDDIQTLFSKSKYFVYCGPTTTACEAFVLGKIVCRFISNNFFSMDCLYFKFDNHRYGFTKCEELEKHISENTTINSLILERYKQYIFNRVDKNCNVNLFI